MQARPVVERRFKIHQGSAVCVTGVEVVDERYGCHHAWIYDCRAKRKCHDDAATKLSGQV